MNNPFDYFENIYCINLDRRTDRWEQVQKEFESVGILNRVHRFSAIESPDGRLGLIKSFLAIFKIAKNEKMKNILIFEDDVKFINNPLEHLQKSISQISDIKWSMFYLGANTHEKLIRVKPNVCLLRNAFSAHAVAYSENLYDKIIHRFENTNSVKSMSDINDVYFSSLQNDNIALVVNPIIATQRPSYSDLEKKVVDYSFIEERYKNNLK